MSYGSYSYPLTATAVLNPNDPTMYFATGSFHQTWSDGTACDYDVKMKLYPQGNKLFIET